MALWDQHLPVVIHNRDEQADLIHVLWGNVKDDGFIVDRIESVLFYGGFLLLQSPPVTKQGHFDIWICASGGDGKGREHVNQMSWNIICSRGTEATDLLSLIRWYQWVVRIIKPPCIYVAHLSLRTLRA